MKERGRDELHTIVKNVRVSVHIQKMTFRYAVDSTKTTFSFKHQKDWTESGQGANFTALGLENMILCQIKAKARSNYILPLMLHSSGCLVKRIRVCSDPSSYHARDGCLYISRSSVCFSSMNSSNCFLEQIKFSICRILWQRVSPLVAHCVQTTLSYLF